MNLNLLNVKSGWIAALRQIAISTPDPVTMAAITAITTPDATDAATAATLANANKAKINAIIAAFHDLT